MYYYKKHLIFVNFQLEKKVLTIDLMELAALLNQTADQLHHGNHQVAFKLKNDALFLEVRKEISLWPKRLSAAWSLEFSPYTRNSQW